MAATRFGSPHHHHRTVDSTNERARELAEEGAATGTVVTADEQSAGRGRGDRRWAAPAGAALLYSAILRPLELRHALLPLSAPLAACEACEEVAPVRCEIKWPNDIWLEQRKLGGVLIEARPPEWAVIGIGINLSIDDEGFPADLRWPAISLGHGTTPEELRPVLDAALGRWVEAPDAEVLAAFAERDALRGREIGWEGGSEAVGRRGIAEGVDRKGNLVVRGQEGEIATLGSGEVHLRLD